MLVDVFLLDFLNIHLPLNLKGLMIYYHKICKYIVISHFLHKVRVFCHLDFLSSHLLSNLIHQTICFHTICNKNQPYFNFFLIMLTLIGFQHLRFCIKFRLYVCQIVPLVTVALTWQAYQYLINDLEKTMILANKNPNRNWGLIFHHNNRNKTNSIFCYVCK